MWVTTDSAASAWPYLRGHVPDQEALHVPRHVRLGLGLDGSDDAALDRRARRRHLRGRSACPPALAAAEAAAPAVSELVFITTEDCHLCEHGRGVLDELAVGRREISASSDEAAALAGRGIPLSFM